MAVDAKLEVEIWRRPTKSTFWLWFFIRSFRQFLAETYRFATIQYVTDNRQTDRQTDDILDHTVGQYAHGLLLESPFVPSSTDCWAARAKIRQKRPSRWP